MADTPGLPPDSSDQSSKTGGDDTVHIKKYGNRRLYSSSDTRFVTLEEIADMVRQGKRVRVVDASTEEDITSEILTQILLEIRRAQHFPVELLEQMIRQNEETLKNFWENYLNQSLQMFLNLQKEMETFYQKFSQKTFQSFNPFLSMWSGTSPRTSNPASPPASSPTEFKEKPEPPKDAPKKPRKGTSSSGRNSK